MIAPIKKVILYSGGLDSLIAAHLISDARLVYIDTKSQYSKKEIAVFGNAPRPVEYDERLKLADMERDDGIVPARNALLAIIGSYYGDEIILVSTAGDRSTDKDEEWAHMMTQLLSHMYGLPHFNPPRDVRVALPFKDLSKGELVEMYLAAGFDPKRLIRAISCYAPEPGHCGKCKACIRKWVALESNGIIQPHWNTHPSEYNGWQPIVDEIKTGGWRCSDEDARTLSLLDSYGVV